MQNLQDLQEKIFFETKNILSSLSQIDSKDELLSKQDLFGEITDRIAFLRILELNKDYFVAEETTENLSHQDNMVLDYINFEQNKSEEINSEEDLMEEEVKFTNEINNVEDEILIEEEPIEEEHSTFEIQENNEVELHEISNETPILETFKEDEKEIPLIVEQEDLNYQEKILQKEREFLESEERRRKIVEFTKEDLPQSVVTEPFADEAQDESLTERKFKLANIKGLKTVQDLFDEDPLDKIEEQKTESNIKSGSLLKTNIETDFMEAAPKKPEFRLDFNDKIAFTKVLFNGDETELKKTIDRLNSFEKMEDAQQYLSEVYYNKNWQKVDEYAQRLWNLVENKFL